MHIMNAYEALDARGLPYVRAAKTVAELGWEKRFKALHAATRNIATQIGLKPKGRIAFGTPVYSAFGLTMAQAKTMPDSKILLGIGADVALSHCSN